MTNLMTHLRPSPNLLPFPNSNVVTIQRLYLSPISTKPLKQPKTLRCSQPQNPAEASSSQNVTFISILRAIPDWADEIKEGRMQTKRALYDHESWVQHRSSLRHIRHLASSLTSRVILSLIPPVIVFTTVAVVIAGYNTAVMAELLPEFFPVLRASSLPYQLTAPALALLLVFRTEASYSRFEEGRKAWTKVIAGSNDLALQVIASVDDQKDNRVIKKELLQYIIAFPFALKCHLVYGSDIRQDLQPMLEADELAIVINSKHSPRCIIEFISQSLQLLTLEESKRNSLEAKLSSFHESIGVCEQLMGIPIPLSYTRLTSRFLFLWHITLPIILWDECHWIVVPATFISASALFCIEEVGVLIEEPFPMLPLHEVCQKIQANIEEAIASEKLIKAKLIAKRKRLCNEYLTNGRPNSQLD
ncbi:hypothetical protein QQ045_031581 [Rhodiola kirilowii]